METALADLGMTATPDMSTRETCGAWLALRRETIDLNDLKRRVQVRADGAGSVGPEGRGKRTHKGKVTRLAPLCSSLAQQQCSVKRRSSVRMGPGLLSLRGPAGGGARARLSDTCLTLWPLAWPWRALPAWPEEERVESSVWTMCQGRDMPLRECRLPCRCSSV